MARRREDCSRLHWLSRLSPWQVERQHRQGVEGAQGHDDDDDDDVEHEGGARMKRDPEWWMMGDIAARFILSHYSLSLVFFAQIAGVSPQVAFK